MKLTNRQKLEKIYTGTIYADDEVLEAAPLNTRVGELEFFNIGKYATSAEVEAEYVKRGLAPAEVLSLAAWNEEHKDDARKYFASQWKDANGNFCDATFNRWDGKRFVRVDRGGGGWHDDWWFSGVHLVPQALGTQDSALHSEPLDLVSRIENMEKWFEAHGFELS